MNLILLSIFIGYVWGQTFMGKQLNMLGGLWDKYGDQDFVHEVEHLREEAINLRYLVESQQISREEVVFYRIKLHDFDRDDKLDGLELIQMVKHRYEHDNVGNESTIFDQVIEHVDQIISRYDKNNDGLIDYGELIGG